MKLKQLSVFLENRPGHLCQLCKTLADAGISMETLTLADTSEFGILRLIVREWQRAKSVLEAAGNAVNVVDVMAIEVPDQAGGMETVLRVVGEAGLSIGYMYAFTLKCEGNALIVIRFDDPDRAAQVLSDAGIGVLSASDFYC